MHQFDAKKLGFELHVQQTEGSLSPTENYHKNIIRGAPKKFQFKDFRLLGGENLVYLGNTVKRKQDRKSQKVTHPETH